MLNAYSAEMNMAKRPNAPRVRFSEVRRAIDGKEIRSYHPSNPFSQTIASFESASILSKARSA